MMNNENRQVLVVEDDRTIRRLLHECLEDEGYRVREAAHGEEALEILEHWQRDVIVLDLMMPRMDGWAFRAEQRHLQRGVDIPLVVLSASRDSVAAGEEMRAAAVVGKPFDLDTFLDVVHA